MLQAFLTMLPVLAMVFLGWISRKLQLVSESVKQGAYSLVLTVFFPILIFKLTASASFAWKDAQIIAYVFAVNVIAYFAMRKLSGRLAFRYKKLSSFLVCTDEGGNVALPLYLSIVGQSSTTVIFDIAIVIFNFILVPVLVDSLLEKKEEGGRMKAMAKNPFLVAVFLGLVFHFSGLWHWIMESGWKSGFTSLMDMMTNPIVPVILFTLGYNLTIDEMMIRPVMKLSVLRLLVQSLMAAGFFVFFPQLMAQKEFLTAVIIYFASPVSFGLLPMLDPLTETREQEQFMFSFSSIYMVVTLVVFMVMSVVYPMLA